MYGNGNDCFCGRGELSEVQAGNDLQTGKVAGSETVQMYISDKEASVERPEKELKGFKKVFLQPGETKEPTLVKR